MNIETPNTSQVEATEIFRFKIKIMLFVRVLMHFIRYPTYTTPNTHFAKSAPNFATHGGTSDFIHRAAGCVYAMLTLSTVHQDEEEDLEEKHPKEKLNFTAAVLREILPKSSDAQDPKSSLQCQHGLWFAVHGSKSAVIGEDPTQVELVDIFDAEKRSEEPLKTIQVQNEVLAMAFSACGDFLAIADSTGTLSLYENNGELLFGHQVVRVDSSDRCKVACFAIGECCHWANWWFLCVRRVVCVRFASEQESGSSSDSQDLVVVTSAGMLLRLGDLRLAEFEQLLRDRPKDALSIILRNIRFERTNIGRLKESAQSCMLVGGRKH
jgi:hypothetical protein